MKNFSVVLAALLVVSISEYALAEQFPVQARLFVGMVSTSPANVNDQLTAGGLKKVNGVTQIGAEATYPLLKRLDVGFRYTKSIVSNDEDPANPNTDYKFTIDQDSVMGVARVPFLKTDVFKCDIFGGLGGSNTTIKLKNAAVDGSLTKRESGDWFASPFAALGASAAVGYKKFYFVVEAGYQSNKISNFKRTGNVDNSIDSVNLSGPYMTVALMFDGLSATK
jgi:hypothetical protein